MTIETWKSNKGAEEIHHFEEGTQTYLFGFNEKLLGYQLYSIVHTLVKERLKELDEQRTKQNL